LNATTEKATYQVLTLPAELSVPVKRMIAVVISAKEKVQNETLPEQQTFGEYHPKHGFVYRFPLTFKDVPSLSRKVSLSNYAVWMGKVRELSLTTVLERVAEQFATGKWGMVTNFIQTEVFGEIESHEVVEVHLQIDKIEDDSYIEIVCYWHKVRQNGELELIATSRQGLTWVEIVGHGLVKIRPFPLYFSQFLQEKLAVMGNKGQIQVRNNALSTELLGEELFTVKNDPVRRFLLQTGRFETSLEESNLVGNIYFSNYTTWQGRVRDQFFYKLAPELYRGTGEHGEWIALNSRIQHLREAMPFDTIEVQMSLLKRYQYGAKLLFEYYKLDENGQKQKLAFGEQDILWIKRDEQGNPIPSVLPEVFERNLAKVPAELLS
jgi:enediyne polyketide synthase